MNVDIVFYYPQMNGITTSLFDMYFNLKKYGCNIKCYIFVDCADMKNNMKYINTINKSIPIAGMNYEFCNIGKLNEWINNHKSENLIVSFAIMKYLSTFDFRYDNLIMLDSGLMFYDYIMNNNKKNKYVQNIPNIKILGNPCNEKFYTNNYYVYYHKFSLERLNYLDSLDKKNGVFDELERNAEDTDEIKFNSMLKNTLKYQRWRNVVDSIYSENIGKLIFEFVYMNKKVYYSSENKSQDDGLTEYLRLFDFDDNVTQEIKFTKQDVINKLCFHKDDLVLKLLR
jgi:hypothetical protein